jgi:UDPglucose 6-dehydrogenase
VENARTKMPDLKYAHSALEAGNDAEVVLLLTEWPEYVGLDPHELGRVVRRRRIVDGRNALDPTTWQAAGWRYRGLGRRLPHDGR